MYKTFSSPNLRDKSTSNDRNRWLNDGPSRTSQQHFFIIGDRVLVDKHRAGSVAFFGELDFSSGDWVGVVLDEPSGNHDGKIHGREYFHCAPQHGLFVRPSRLIRLQPEFDPYGIQVEPVRTTTPQSQTKSQSPYNNELGAKYGSLFSSPRPMYENSTLYSPSGRSTTESSYYYDDDYRKPFRPSVESLERKLKSINNQGKSNQDYWTKQSQPTRSHSVLSVSTPDRSNSLYELGPNKSQVESVFNFRPQRIRVDDYATQPPTTTNINKTTSTSHSTGRLLDFTSKPLHLNDRILVRSFERNIELTGTLRYLGETEFATGEWAGVELDEQEGRNDGTVLGVRYFRCPENYGLFVPASRVTRLNPRADFASSVKSTIKSPPPPIFSSKSSRQYEQNSYNNDTSNHNHHHLSSSGGRSTPASPASSGDRYTPSSLSLSLSPSPSNNANNKHYETRHQYSPNHFDYQQSQPNYSSSSAYSSSNFSSAGSTSLPKSSAKFRESDLDSQLKRYTTSRRPPKLTNQTNIRNNIKHSHSHSNHYDHDCNEIPIYNDNNQNRQQRPQPRSIKYTFKSSKYDGSPIAVKTVQYDDDED